MLVAVVVFLYRALQKFDPANTVRVLICSQTNVAGASRARGPALLIALQWTACSWGFSGKASQSSRVWEVFARLQRWVCPLSGPAALMWLSLPDRATLRASLQRQEQRVGRRPRALLAWPVPGHPPAYAAEVRTKAPCKT
jgi:hypothetical protein